VKKLEDVKAENFQRCQQLQRDVEDLTIQKLKMRENKWTQFKERLNSQAKKLEQSIKDIHNRNEGTFLKN